MKYPYLASLLLVLLLFPVATESYSTDSVARVQQAYVELESAENSILYYSDREVQTDKTAYMEGLIQSPADCDSPPPIPISPSNDSSTGLVPSFTYRAIGEVDIYAFQISLVPDFSTYELIAFTFYSAAPDAGIDITHDYLSRNLAKDTLYYWRAWSICNDSPSASSQVLSFVTDRPGVLPMLPAIVSPKINQTINSSFVRFAVEEIPSVERYYVEILERLINPSYSIIAYNSNNTIDFIFLENGTYYWRTQVRNDYGFSQKSAIQSFVIADTKPSLNVNYFDGASGSYFHLTATNFPENATAEIAANGQFLGNVQIDANGIARFGLLTDFADDGFYTASVTTDKGVSRDVSFIVDSGSPNRPFRFSDYLFYIFDGTAKDLSEQQYLPIMGR